MLSNMYNHFHLYQTGLAINLRWVNSSPPSAAFMCQWIWLALIQIMACCLFGTKPLVKTNAGLLSIGPLQTNFSEVLIKLQNFSLTKVLLKMSSAKWQPFCPWGDELIKTGQVTHWAGDFSIFSINEDNSISPTKGYWTKSFTQRLGVTKLILQATTED